MGGCRQFSACVRGYLAHSPPSQLRGPAALSHRSAGSLCCHCLIGSGHLSQALNSPFAAKCGRVPCPCLFFGSHAARAGAQGLCASPAAFGIISASPFFCSLFQDWQEILSLYEKENTYLGKAASPHRSGTCRCLAGGSRLLSSCRSSGCDLLGTASAWRELTCTPSSHVLSQVPASCPIPTFLSLLQPV